MTPKQLAKIAEGLPTGEIEYDPTTDSWWSDEATALELSIAQRYLEGYWLAILLDRAYEVSVQRERDRFVVRVWVDQLSDAERWSGPTRLEALAAALRALKTDGGAP